MLVVEQDFGEYEEPSEYVAKLDYLGRTYWFVPEGVQFKGKVIGIWDDDFCDCLSPEDMKLIIDSFKRGDPPERTFEIFITRRIPPWPSATGVLELGKPREIGREERYKISRECSVRYLSIDAERRFAEVITDRFSIKLEFEPGMREVAYEVLSLHGIERPKEELNDVKLLRKVAELARSILSNSR